MCENLNNYMHEGDSIKVIDYVNSMCKILQSNSVVRAHAHLL